MAQIQPKALVLLVSWAVRRQPLTYYPKESVITLDIDAKNEKTPGNDVFSAYMAGPAKKILLLEDRDDFREVLHDYLSSRSCQVTSVPSGVEGLRKIMTGAFDLILCDMMMPRVGGEMFYWAVTRVRPAAGRRFIFFTGHKNNPQIEFFFQRVDATVLYKPFTLEVLDGAIRNVLRKLH